MVKPFYHEIVPLADNYSRKSCFINWRCSCFFFISIAPSWSKLKVVYAVLSFTTPFLLFFVDPVYFNLTPVELSFLLKCPHFSYNRWLIMNFLGLPKVYTCLFFSNLVSFPHFLPLSLCNTFDTFLATNNNFTPLFEKHFPSVQFQRSISE